MGRTVTYYSINIKFSPNPVTSSHPRSLYQVILNHSCIDWIAFHIKLCRVVGFLVIKYSKCVSLNLNSVLSFSLPYIFASLLEFLPWLHSVFFLDLNHPWCSYLNLIVSIVWEAASFYVKGHHLCLVRSYFNILLICIFCS